jgi:starch phosphorylase
LEESSKAICDVLEAEFRVAERPKEVPPFHIHVFIFGQREDEVRNNLLAGYNARQYYDQNDRIREAVDALEAGFAGKSFADLRSYLLDGSYSIADPYMCLADFDDYCRAHDDMSEAYEDRTRWNTMSVENIANAARFSADRSIVDYAKWIWHAKPEV